MLASGLLTGNAGSVPDCIGGLHLVEQVPGAGQQLAGDRDGGDLLPAAFRDGRVGSGQRPEYLDPRVGLGVLVQLAVDPVGQRRQAVDDCQAVGDDLP